MGVAGRRSEFNPDQLSIFLIICRVICRPYTQNRVFLKHRKARQHLAGTSSKRSILIDTVLRGKGTQCTKAVTVCSWHKWNEQDEDPQTRKSDQRIKTFLKNEQN